MKRYLGGLMFVFGVACLVSAAMQPITQGTGLAVAFIVLALVVPGAIWLFRKSPKS